MNPLHCFAAVLACLIPWTLAAASEVAALEAAYADFNDAAGALALIDSGLRTDFGGKDRAAWAQAHAAQLARLQSGLPHVKEQGLSAQDARAVIVMREAVQAAAEQTAQAPHRNCNDAQRRDLDARALREALYACFDTLANNLEFEGARHTRIAAFDLLARLPEPERRKQLFHAFTPLWRAVNGGGERDSPYRRMIVAAAQDARTHGSAVDAAAGTLGVSSDTLEQWLLQILEAWRRVSGDAQIEPWDYRYLGGAADRALGERIDLAQMQPINERFYRDLGADLQRWQVIYDLAPRPGKAPLAYTDYVSRGRMIDKAWRPTQVRVSGNYARGGLGLLNELVHENGHVVHMMALRTRPAFMDLGDAVFFEAFADAPSWSTYEPAWQRKYLGAEANERDSLRALYSNVMLDVAWALFDLRMLREPTLDPNQVWTDITSRYLHVKPHPELAWWAVRVQLVDSPGYMVNYGLGAIVTADLRARIRERLGPFDTGDPRWFEWLSRELLSSGAEHRSTELLHRFLGRAPSPDALLQQIARIRPAD